MLRGPNCTDGGQKELRAVLDRKRLELVSLGRPEVERLLDQQRLVEEVGLRRDQRRRNPVAGKVTQRQKRLEPRHAPANDHHTISLAACLVVHRGNNLSSLSLSVEKASRHVAAGYWSGDVD
jgi:hypothetical protein